MPRRARCVLPGVPYHVTQRGVDRQATFSLDEDRHTYLRLLRENLSEADVRVWGWCLMSNHVHLVLLPGREDSLSLLMRRVHGRYAQYYNTRWGRTGHLWQNRFFSCILGIEHLWAALAYVERNPVRAGMVHSAAEYSGQGRVARPFPFRVLCPTHGSGGRVARPFPFSVSASASNQSGAPFSRGVREGGVRGCVLLLFLLLFCFGFQFVNLHYAWLSIHICSKTAPGPEFRGSD